MTTVADLMVTDVLTVEPDTTVEAAAKIMLDHNFRHLPVVKDGRVLGIVSLRLLSRWAFESVVGPPG